MSFALLLVNEIQFLVILRYFLGSDFDENSIIALSAENYIKIVFTVSNISVSHFTYFSVILMLHIGYIKLLSMLLTSAS